MCGMAGIVDTQGQLPIDRTVLERLNGVEFHSGLDEGGTVVAPGMGLAHRWVSVIDFSAGQKLLFNQERSIRIVFNGEIPVALSR